jgi:hypothetical protein
MLHFINHHGIEFLLIGWVYSALASTIPPLPKDAGFWATWGYGFVHVTSANLSKIPAIQNAMQTLTGVASSQVGEK